MSSFHPYCKQHTHTHTSWMLSAKQKQHASKHQTNTFATVSFRQWIACVVEKVEAIVIFVCFERKNFGLSGISMNHDDSWQISKVSADWYRGYYAVGKLFRRESQFKCWPVHLPWPLRPRERNILDKVHRKTTPNFNIVTFKKKLLSVEKREIYDKIAKVGYKLGIFFFLALLCSMWDLSSPTRDQTCAPCSGSVEA